MKYALLLMACVLLPGVTSAAVPSSSATEVAGSAPTNATVAAVKTTLPQAARVQALSAQDIPALVQPPKRGARLISLWALDCAYCEPNLKALAALQRAHPREFQLVTVATDSIEQQAAIAARLRQAGVTAYPAYAYGEATPERLNFLLDPRWGGETPRVLLIRADGTRVGVSGELTPAQLKKLL